MTNKRTGNGNGKSGSKGKQQIPPLRCGMTNKGTGNGHGKSGSKGNSRFLRCAAE
jgi:hypothetical protein